MTTAWFQCSAGASGDMFLGALVDAGVPLDVVQSAADSIGVEPIVVSVESVTRQGLAATKVDVKTPRSAVIRTWANVRAMLEQAELEESVRARSLDAFERLAKAEAAAHRTTPEQVLFHEVGALDAIADVVGTAAALAFLGVETAVATPVAVGNGMVRGQHGLMSVPGPAVLSILSDAQAPIYSGDAPYELCTPTGAALLASTVSVWGGLPQMRITTVGTGAGSRELAELPNVLRVVVGEAVPALDDVPATSSLLIETNVDDLDPRLWPPVLARLLAAGANDAWLTPIVMKKGRPAYSLSVLCDESIAGLVRRVVFTETSAIGLRERNVAKRALDREICKVHVDGVEISVKIARLGGEVVNVQPEYEDVVAAAAELGRPVKTVLAAATAAARDAGLLP